MPRPFSFGGGDMGEPVLLAVEKVVVDEEVYPRSRVDDAVVARYAECLREGASFPPVEVEQRNGVYRVLDGVHRVLAHKQAGMEAVPAVVVDLGSRDPLLYAAERNRHGQPLRDDDARSVARRAFERNPGLSVKEIALAVGRSERAVRDYIRDLKARYELQRDLTIFKLHLLGWTQEQIAEAVGLDQSRISQKLAMNFGKTAEIHSQSLPVLVVDTATSISSDYRKGFSVAEIAEKNKWPEPLVWAVVLRGKDDLARFKELGWPLRTWDLWNFNDVDSRFGDPWPGNIPAQLVAHVLYFFTRAGALVFDPMAGGGVVPDVCLAFGRRCYAVDMKARRERPEIVRHEWKPGDLCWPEWLRAKPDLIFWDPPYFRKMAADYGPGSVSALPREEYLQFFRDALRLFAGRTAPGARLAFLIADWREFESTPALEEDESGAVLLYHYWRIMEEAGWRVTHRIECPLSTQRMNGGIVQAMQEKRILGVVSRTLLVARRV